MSGDFNNHILFLLRTLQSSISHTAAPWWLQDCSARVLLEQLFVYPHEAAGLVGLGLVLDAVEAVAELAVLSLVVVVVFHLPYGFKRAGVFELATKRRQKVRNNLQLSSYSFRWLINLSFVTEGWCPCKMNTMLWHCYLLVNYLFKHGYIHVQ